MRYAIDEVTTLVGTLPAGSSVTVKIVELGSDSEVTLTDNTCTESTVISGMYIFDTSKMEAPTVYTNYVYEMTNGVEKFYGKFVMGGSIESDLKDVLSILSQIPADVWAHTVRDLTVQTGLTDEQATKLMNAASRSDVYAASLIA